MAKSSWPNGPGDSPALILSGTAVLVLIALCLAALGGYWYGLSFCGG